jgi:hypothetical protein
MHTYKSLIKLTYKHATCAILRTTETENR